MSALYSTADLGLRPISSRKMPKSVNRAHPVFYLGKYFTPGIDAKSASCDQSVASNVRAVARMMLSAMGRRSWTLVFAAARARSAVRSTTCPCCMAATACRPSPSPRCCSIRLNTSYRLMAGTIRSSVASIAAAKRLAPGVSAKYYNHAYESTTFTGDRPLWRYPFRYLSEIHASY